MVDVNEDSPSAVQTPNRALEDSCVDILITSNGISQVWLLWPSFPHILPEDIIVCCWVMMTHRRWAVFLCCFQDFPVWGQTLCPLSCSLFITPMFNVYWRALGLVDFWGFVLSLRILPEGFDPKWKAPLSLKASAYCRLSVDNLGHSVWVGSSSQGMTLALLSLLELGGPGCPLF